MQASTCVVDYLSFAADVSNRRDTSATIKELYLVFSVLCVTENESELATDFWVSPTKTRSRHYLYTRQRERDYSRQLLL